MTRIEYQQIQWSKNHRVNKNNIVERQCTQCGEWKEEDINNFSFKNKTIPEKGFFPWCKICNTKRQLNKYYNDGGITKQKTIDAAAIRYHTVESDKEIKLKNGNRQREEGYQSNWFKNNPEKCRDYTKRHRIHDITEKEWRGCLKVFDNQCAYCGLPIEEHIVKRKGKYIIMNFHKDHVDDDGANDLRNAVPACQSCNSSKHVSSLDEWYKRQNFFDRDKYNKILWWISEGYLDYIENKPPYRIIRKQNEGLKTFHWELWSVDSLRNMIECIDIKSKKKDIDLKLLPINL